MMKFLIQKINGEVKHDFAFTLIRAAEYHNWLHSNEIIIKYIDFGENILEPDDILPNPYKLFHGNYVPVGSVEFVTNHLQQFFNLLPKPHLCIHNVGGSVLLFLLMLFLIIF